MPTSADSVGSTKLRAHGAHGAHAARGVDDKGLRPNAVTFFSNLVVGVSSTAPAYSLASSLGIIAGLAGFATPAIMLVAFLPVFCIAVAFAQLNRAHPDCGTTFAWVTLTMGPHAGWLGGWAMIATNILVMPSLAVIAGQYTFELVGVSAPSAMGVTIVGGVWIAGMTMICYLGIQASVRTQNLLLGAEVLIMLLFAAVALFKAATGRAPEGATFVAAAWFNPFSSEASARFSEAMMVAVFLYWGWDSGLSINEETEDPAHAPGKAALLSTLLLLGLYLMVTVAALAYAGPARLASNSADVFAPIAREVLGPALSPLLVLAVLTSVSAATQTTILPGARTALSMAAAGALPRRFARMHPVYLNPGFATLVMGGVSIAWFIGLSLVSKNVLDDSVLAIGILISFYYALTAFACVLRYRRQLTRSALHFVSLGLLPAAGGLAMACLFLASCVSLSKSGTTAVLGLGGPLLIGLGALVVGGVLLLIARTGLPEFFKQG